MKKAILLASATFLFAVYSQAQVQRPVSPTQQVQSDPAGHGKMKNELNLSKDQKVQMKALHQENKQQMEAIKNDASLTPDQKKEKMKELRKSQSAKINSILTPDQQAKRKEIMEQRRQNHMQNGKRMHKANGTASI